MTRLKYLFGATGFLSLLGFIGIFSDSKVFLAFFAFAVDFQYFFIKEDEMWTIYMCRSASKAFCLGMIVMAMTTLISFLLGKAEQEALVSGLAAGWASAIIFNAIQVAIYGFAASREIDK